MSYQVFLTSNAELAIASSALWWSEHRDVDQAIAWYQGIRDAIATLCDNPERLPMIHEHLAHDWTYSYRQLIYGMSNKPTHRVVYRIKDNAVYVITVRHLHQQDLEPRDLEGG